MVKSYWAIRLACYAYIIYAYFALVKANSFYSFLFLNAILAYIPIELAMHINPHMSRWWFGSVFVGWLLFYPNAPYILTDLFHLAKINPYSFQTGLMVLNINKWIYFTNLVVAALAGALLGQWSLLVMVKTLAQRFKLSLLAQRSITLLLLFFSAVGIFVGRFLRIHTIYLLVEPHKIFKELIAMWNLPMIEYVGLMLVIQLVIWGSYEFTRHDLTRFN